MPGAAAVISQSGGNQHEKEKPSHHGCWSRKKGLGSLQTSLSHWVNTETFYLQTPCDVNSKGPYI